TVVFAAGGHSALKVRGGIVGQQAGCDRSGGQQAVQNVDGGIESLFQQVGAGFKLEPAGILGSGFQLAFDAGACVQQACGLATAGAAAQMGFRSDLSEAGAGHAQLENAGVGIGVGEQ